MYQYPALRSVQDEVKSYVRFMNLTTRKVDIVWVNYTGHYVCYESLNYGQFLDVNTYKNHPWIAFDHDTKDRMHLNKEFVYSPQTAEEFLRVRYPNHNFNIAEIRLPVRITLPVHSLRYHTLLYIKNFFQNSNEVDELNLDLPHDLIGDLKRIIEYRNNLNTIPYNR